MQTLSVKEPEGGAKTTSDDDKTLVMDSPIDDSSRRANLSKEDEKRVFIWMIPIFILIAAMVVGFLYYQGAIGKKVSIKSEPYEKVDTDTNLPNDGSQAKKQSSGKEETERSETIEAEQITSPLATNSTLPHVQISENSSSKVEALIRQSLVYYVEGKVEKSLIELEKIASLDPLEKVSLKTRAKTYLEKIRQAQALFYEGKTEYKNGHPEVAFQIWVKLLEIDQHLIGQKSSYFSNSIAEYMSNEYVRRARKEYENANYAEAHKNCQKALTIRPGLKGAVDIKRRLSERAEKLYGDGHILEALDPHMAIRKWREILTISDPDNEFYQKASKRLAKY